MINKRPLIFFVGIFLLCASKFSFGWGMKSHIEVEIHPKKSVFQVLEPVDGTVILRNMTRSLPATFNIFLFHDGVSAGEGRIHIPKVFTGTMKFSFKDFAISQFNNNTGAQGEWIIKILQQNVDESYATSSKVEIVPAD
jgi:hypothetical protein